MVESGGQAAISLVFLIGMMVTLIGVALAFLILAFLNSSYGFQAAQQALAVASSGAEDALLELARNKEFCPSPCLSNSGTYSVQVGNTAATVTVSVADLPTIRQVTILSKASVAFRNRSVQALVSIASGTGQVALISWQEVPQ